MRTYKACVVGGGLGGRLSMTALTASNRFELLAAADLRPEICAELQTLYPGIRTYTSHREMFREVPVDVVCVSTYASSHAEVTHDALQLPLDGILVEKPLADTVEMARGIVQAIKAKGIPVTVPHVLAIAPHSAEAIERVRRGDIGQLKLVEIECTRWDIINAGIHWLHYFVTLTQGDPIDHVLCACDCSTRTYRDGMQVETAAVTLAQTKSGVRCMMITGDHVLISREGKKTMFRLIGTEGTIEFWGWDSTYRIQNAEHPHGKIFDRPFTGRAGHQIMLEMLADQMDRKTADYSIAENSLVALEICEAAYASSKHQCVMQFPLGSFAIPEKTDWDAGKPYAGVGGGRDGRKL